VVIAVPRSARKLRKHLSADGLYALVRKEFEAIPDTRDPSKISISLGDCLMSAFAMFSLKDPSLLAFDARRDDNNMKQLFGIGQVPSDTTMRESLDEVSPSSLRPVYAAVFRQLQRGKALEPFVFYKNCYLLSLDGTGYFSSKSIHCESCLTKTSSTTGEVTYQHQMLGAVLVHPDFKEVIPLAPEPIVRQDGNNKNDCERNAAKRLLRQIRQDHPRLGLIVVEDGLASNAPHVREIVEQGMHFILGVKPGDHPFLFDHVIKANEEGRATIMRWKVDGVQCEIVFVNEVPLNESNQDLLVNYFEYSEYDAEGNQVKHFSWITDFTVTRANARLLVPGGRARWKIENETFNTLKNQGYHYEHNFGHGDKNLCNVFAMLMMLAFLVDQVQQLCCPLFRAVLHKLRTKRALWDNLRSHFRHFLFTSMRQLYETILHDRGKEVPLPDLDDSS
jgi:hypothetical protein